MAPNPNKQQNPGQKVRERLRQRHENRVAHREERQQKERERFTQQPTGRQARHQAHAYANQEYNPTIRGIREEAAKTAKQAQLANQWYGQLGSEQAQAANEQLANANSFSSSLTQQLANANAQNAQTLAQQEAANAQFAAATGMQGASGQAAAAGANMTNIANVALNAPNLQGAYSQAALTRRLGIASKERGHEVQQGLLGERKKINQDLRAAQKQKGQAYVGRLGELRESARKQELDKKAFELEGQQTALNAQQEAEKLRQDEIQNKRSAQVSRENSQRTAASSAASTAASTVSAEASAKNARIAEEKFQAEQRYKRNHGGRTPAEVTALQKERGRSPAEKTKHREQIKSTYVGATHAIKQLNENPKTMSPKAWDELYEYLTAPASGAVPGLGSDPSIAQRVIEIIKKRSGWSVSADPNENSLGR